MAEVQEHHEATDLPLDMLVHLAEYCHLVTIGKLHCCTRQTKQVWRSFHIIYHDELQPFERFSTEQADLILDPRLENTLFKWANWVDEVHLPDKTGRLTPRLCSKWAPSLKHLSILTTAREFPHLIPNLDPLRLEQVHIRLDISASRRSLEPLRTLFSQKSFPRLRHLSVALQDSGVLDSFIDSTTGQLESLFLDLSIIFLEESEVPEILRKIQLIVQQNPKLTSLAVNGDLFSLDALAYPSKDIPLEQTASHWYQLRRVVPEKFGVPIQAFRPTQTHSAGSSLGSTYQAVGSVWAFCFEKFLWYSYYDKEEDLVPLPPVAQCQALFEDCLVGLEQKVMGLAEVFLPREVTTGVDKAPLLEYPEEYYFWIETTIRKLVSDATENSGIIVEGGQGQYYAVIASATLYSLLEYHRRDSRGALILLRNTLDRDPEFSLAYLYYCMKPFGNLFIDIYGPLMEGLSWKQLQQRGAGAILDELLRWTRPVHILTLHDDIPVNFRIPSGSSESGLLLPKLFFYHTTLEMLRKLSQLKREFPEEAKSIPPFTFNMSLIDLLNTHHPEAVVLFAPLCQGWNDILGVDGHKFVSFAHILLDITRIQVGLQHSPPEIPDHVKNSPEYAEKLLREFQLSPELEDAILSSLDTLAQKTARRTNPGEGGWLFGPS